MHRVGPLLTLNRDARNNEFKITTTRRVIIQNSAVIRYFPVKALNNFQFFFIIEWFPDTMSIDKFMNGSKVDNTVHFFIIEWLPYTMSIDKFMNGSKVDNTVHFFIIEWLPDTMSIDKFMNGSKVDNTVHFFFPLKITESDLL